MKAFLKWLILALIIFGGVSSGYHFYLESNPRRILVILDSSFPMGQVWEKIPGVLEGLEGKRYAKYALASDKGLIHGWMDGLRPGRTVPYAPRNLKDMEKRLALNEIKEASEIYLVTNAISDELPAAKGWKVIRM